ncbi:MAG: hypothetical protein NZ914_13040 [Gemmatales bacterium]|nr:hypothetical protein [Gemmatales bacterium]
MADSSRQALEELWRQTDEQIVDAELRPLLRANGLRCGILAGTIPPALRSRLLSAPTAPQLFHFFLARGQAHFHPCGGPWRYLACPIYYAGESTIAEFSDAQLGLSFQWTNNKSNDEEFVVIPAVRHRLTNPAPFLWSEKNCWPLATGESETQLAFLKIPLALTTQQTLVLGAYLDKEPSLGSYLFQDPQTQQTRVLLVRLRADGDKATPGNDSSSLFPNPANRYQADDREGAN